MSSSVTMLEPPLPSWSPSSSLYTILRTGKVTLLPLNSSEVLMNTSRHCVWKNERMSASQSGTEIRNSLNTRGKSGRDHIATIILFYLMHITCATIVVSRGLESTAECWTVWTGRRKVSGGRSVDSGGRVQPLPTSVGRTLTALVACSASKYTRSYSHIVYIAYTCITILRFLCVCVWWKWDIWEAGLD